MHLTDISILLKQLSFTHENMLKASDTELYARFISETINVLGHEQNVALRAMTVTEISKEKFLKILKKLVSGQEGVSRQERQFLQKFWSALVPERKALSQI